MIYFDAKCRICDTQLNTENRRRNENLCKTCRREKEQNERKILKEKLVIEYGGFCVCCKKDNIEFLTIDHIFADGWSHRKENGNKAGYHLYSQLAKQEYPKDRYQLLCWNCNAGKSDGKICPHKNKNLPDAHNFENIIKFNNKIGNILKLCNYCGIELNKNNTKPNMFSKKCDYKC